ncbi:phosphoglycerate mutase-like protein [Coniochaeta ligniaria NRRL 30616]|uniref:Phosphoglycerate mutase-like protein n=1 Tax=Coniochaeta ligniaria NRRL 30616 TaxID=1408157 RepID=A0A1J7JV29_9PEZI|nr:phosphoglycerate mutase-like protein [Coniochaeta ligniaria NRRL 30616]
MGLEVIYVTRHGLQNDRIVSILSKLVAAACPLFLAVAPSALLAWNPATSHPIVVSSMSSSVGQFRSNWAVDPSTGEYTASISSPTGIAADPTLTAHGVDQARQLAAHLRTVDPPIERVYSSPYYRCLQTIEPFVAQAPGSPVKGEQSRIRGEPGLGEWYGAAPFEHPTSAAPQVLKRLFPALDLDYEPVARPSRVGESLAELHDRVAITIDRIISQCDAEGVKAILLCTHAAVVIALGRVLTGAMPDDVGVEDFGAFTCGLSVYTRRKGDAATLVTNTGGRISGDQEATSARGIAPGPPAEPCPHRHTSRTDPEPLPWKGRGVAGGWICTANSDCSHLASGEERGWRFSGDEAFTGAAESGVDAGLELGIVVEGQAVRTWSTKTGTNSRL